jgi:ubiquinone/menaquinone biosynthesis C-methylase UbiE
MQDDAYKAMRSMQEHHWWWQGMRGLYRAVLARFVPGNRGSRDRLRVIDIGCGFGANIPVLESIGTVVGVDVSLDALRAIRNRPTLGLVQAAATALPFRAETFDVLALLAVVEHVDQDDQALAESYRVARRGAIQLLLTSAFMLLWSHHDRANRHRRRYRAHELDCKQRVAGWRILTTSYTNAVIFPAVAVVRIVQRLTRGSTGQPEAPAYDMGPNSGLFGVVPRFLLGVEARLITRGIRLPFGVNLISVSQRD